MRVLVTGGAGFIGSHLCDLLLRRGDDVIALDNLDAQVHPANARPAYLDPRVPLIVADVRDRDSLRKAMSGVEAVFHLAAVVGVGQSQYEIARYVDVNVGGTASLLDLLANEKHTVRKVIVASSMSIYGEGSYIGNEPAPTPESKERDCQSVYALTKRDQEEYTLLWGRTYGIPAVAARLFNTYGARQSLRNPYTGAAAIFLSRARRGLPPLIYEDGAQQRDFVDVRDVARAFVLMLESNAANGRALNVASGHPITILALAQRICALTGTGVEPEVTGRVRKGDIRHCIADTSAIRALGFAPQIDLDRGLTDLAAWTEAEEIAADDARVNAELEQRRLLV
jgi:dTDP-L-rhamnose 4-epimerase